MTEIQKEVVDPTKTQRVKSPAPNTPAPDGSELPDHPAEPIKRPVKEAE